MSVSYPCRDCGVTLRSGRRNSPQRCAPCTTSHVRTLDRSRSRERYRDPKVAQRLREQSRLRTYGISPEEFDAMLLVQAGRCAICRTDNPGRRDWCLDHCHRTGRWRGVLCNPCNWALGHFRDDPAVCRQAAAYLDERGGA